MLTITFDVEPDLHSQNYRSVTEGLVRIISILDKYKIKATFFLTCDCLEKYPKIFQKLKNEGHELALHGYKHVRFDLLTRKEKEIHLQKAISCFQKYLKINPKGFRAVQHSIDNETLILLEKYGFRYDSSFTPLNLLQLFFFPLKKQSYTHFFSSLDKYKIRGNLSELPISSFFFPFVSLLFRAFPLSLINIYFSVLKLITKNQVFYAHSWDFIDVKGKIARTFPKEKLISNLDRFLNANKNKFSKLIDLT
mgnify:CR=1 FL=1